MKKHLHSGENDKENTESNEISSKTQQQIEENTKNNTDSNNTQNEADNPVSGASEEEHSKKGSDGKKVRLYKMVQSGTLTVGFLIAIVLINIIVTVLCQRYPSLNLDLTTSHTNTLSADAVKVAQNVKEPTTIYIMASEEVAKGDALLAEYGIKYSQVSALANKMAEKNPKIQVKYVNLDKNPTFASLYKEENLTIADVLVKTEKRHRILTYTDLFSMQQSQEDGSSTAYSMVDSALASAVNSVNAEKLPLVIFENGHNELLDTSLYKSLLTSNQFETKEINLLTNDIPKDTQIFIMPTPSTDYTKEEIKKLDAFLSNTSQPADCSLMVTFVPSQEAMPNLTTFLNEWGLHVKQGEVLESSRSNYYTDPSFLFANVSQSVNLGGNNAYQYLLMPQSSPVERLFDSHGDIRTYDLITSSATSYRHNTTATGEEQKSEQSENTLAALAQKKRMSGGKEYKSNVIAVGSSYMFIDSVINASTFADRAYLLDLTKYAAGVTGTIDLVEPKAIETTTTDITMSAGVAALLGFGVFTVLIPITICIIGAVVYNRRRRK